MTKSQDLCRVLSSLDLRQSQVHRLVDTITKWVSSSGEEWTVSRLKDLHRFYLCKEAGTLDSYESSTWIKTNEKGLRGPFSVLNGKDLKTQLFATRVYTLFQAKSPTAKQLEKFRNAAFFNTREPVLKGGAMPTSEYIHKFYPTIQPSRKYKVLRRMCRTIEEHSWSETKSVPMGTLGSVRENKVGTWVKWDMGNPFIRHHIRNYRTLSAEVGLLEPFTDKTNCDAAEKWVEDHLAKRGKTIADDRVIGRLGYIQEPGYKLRIVANPSRSLQVLLDPLKQSLKHILKNEPGIAEADCTFNQEKGVAFALQSLRDGKTVHSIDLSNATDSFPLRYTVGVLTDFLDMDDQLTKESVEAFARISHRLWYDPHSKESHAWSKGQPLGLGPSFFAFALSHHSLVRWIEKHNGLEPGSSYRILGDDIVINHDKVARQYIHYVRDAMGCKISESKSLISQQAAEFAGKVATLDSVISLCKYAKPSDWNFVEIARQLGPKSLRFLRPRQRRAIKLIAEIPEFAGGLGWNPKGKPIEERIEYAISLNFLEDPDEARRVINPLIPHRRLSNKVYYEDGISLARDNSLTKKTPVSVQETYTETADIVNTSVGVEQDVREDSNWPSSVKSGDPRGNQSTLETLEAKVKPKPKGPRLR